MKIDRRKFLQLGALGGGAVLASSLPGCASLGAGSGANDFYFVQLSDTHWGFNGPAVNPDARGTLPKAIAAVNALDPQPDFIVFTGDLTHTTDDPKARRERMKAFRDVAFPGPPTTVREFARDDRVTLYAEAYENRKKPHMVTFTVELRDPSGRVVDTHSTERETAEKPKAASTYAFAPTLALDDVEGQPVGLELPAQVAYWNEHSTPGRLRVGVEFLEVTKLQKYRLAGLTSRERQRRQ